MSYEERLKVQKWPALQQRLFSSLAECYKTINRLNGLDPSNFFTFGRDSRLNHCFKLKSVSAVSATLNSFKHSFSICIIDEWNNLPKEIAAAENLIIF